jgi:hypothetical protein
VNKLAKCMGIKPVLSPLNSGADEFILDWLLNSPNGTQLVSRIMVSPFDIKRIIAAQETLITTRNNSGLLGKSVQRIKNFTDI